MQRLTTLFAILALTTFSFFTYAEKTELSGIDSELVRISTHPEMYQLTAQAKDQVNSRATIKIHSTAPLANNEQYVQLLPGSIRYFRTDGAASDDGEHAKITWSINGKSYSTNIGRPGAVIMAIRSLGGVVTWYALQQERRC